VFSTYEDTAGKTHVVTGDGIAGARLTTGASVTANYRIGSGATVPPGGTLTQILKPVPNLAQVRNPVSPFGGADPDPASALRQYAPRSVLTFGRAVSGDDYAAAAALTPGVTRASAVWAWDADEQRSLVHVYVGDDDGAVTAARTALAEQADPNRPIVVIPATRRRVSLKLTLLVDPAYVLDDVVTAARAALVTGLFAPGVLHIGQTLFRSQIEAVCQVPGVLAVHGITMSWLRSVGSAKGFGFLLLVRIHSPGPRFSPGEGGFFTLDGDDLTVGVEQT
jgi:predicted phage baseplate assembly protein